jgi:hypothetical protein
MPASVSQFKTLWNDKPATAYRNRHLSGDTSYLVVLDGTAKIESNGWCKFNGGDDLGVNQELQISRISPDKVLYWTGKDLRIALLFPNAWKLAGCDGK